MPAPPGILRQIPINEIAAPAKQGSPHHWHKAFSIPYIYDYITKLSRQQAEVIQNHENVNVRNIGQGVISQKMVFFIYVFVFLD
jgi:hypothetical protein